MSTPAYSETSGKTYPSWGELVAAEANGFAVIAIISRGEKTWPWIEGQYPTKAEATKAKARAQTRMRRSDDLYPGTTYELFVRPIWKDPREVKAS